MDGGRRSKTFLRLPHQVKIYTICARFFQFWYVSLNMLCLPIKLNKFIYIMYVVDTRNNSIQLHTVF